MNCKKIAKKMVEKINNTMPLQEELGTKCSIKKIHEYQEGIIERALARAYKGSLQMDRSQAIEKLAAYIHDRLWSDWLEYLLFQVAVLNPGGGVTVKKSDVGRLTQKMNTEYFSLPDKEKELNRKSAMGILEAIGF
ncbi:MAG: hypothetical protein AB1478_12635 [Nitrospirota bacterium]